MIVRVWMAPSLWVWARRTPINPEDTQGPPPLIYTKGSFFATVETGSSLIGETIEYTVVCNDGSRVNCSHDCIRVLQAADDGPRSPVRGGVRRDSRGEPACAVQLAAHLVFAASLGWDGPSLEAPTAFDFKISDRWLPLL